ncbi:hypothetical protein [Leuconostoc lactis]
MTETVVHVTTIEEWKSVLDVWFEHGYSWYSGDKEYHGGYFKDGIRELLLNKDNDILIPIPEKREQISYKEFMTQQKEDNKMETYYVTQDKLHLIEKLRYMSFPLYQLTHTERFKEVGSEFDGTQEKALLRYLGGDEKIEFKVKETLYRLWRIDDDGDKVYMRFNLGTPTWFENSTLAFTAPLEEIKKWQTPAWEIEKAD